jgi:hypothetical protein
MSYAYIDINKVKIDADICINYYCKQVPSETTGASSDIYCQSMIIIFKHHPLFMWNQYRWNIAGNCREHRERERERDVANWGERERTEMLRENGMGFKLRSTLVDFDRWSKSAQSIFGYGKWPYQHKHILRHGKQSNQHRGYFWIDVCLQQLFWRYILSSNNTGLHHFYTIKVLYDDSSVWRPSIDRYQVLML